MRVLILTPDFPPAPGGIQLVMSRLAANLDAEVSVVTLAHDGRRSEPPDGVTLTWAGSRAATGNKLANVRLNAAGLAKALRFRPDVVISGHAAGAPGASCGGLLTGAPLIQYLHADEARQRPALLRFAMGRAAGVIAVSEHARQLALSAGCEAERVRVIHPGVDPPEFRPEPRAEAPTIITVARMQMAYKGHDTMIRALPTIRRDVPGVRWLAVGDGVLRPELERLAADLGVGDCAHFTGHVSDDERDRLLASAHVFALPSRAPEEGTGGEGFGIVFLEAGAHRLPVLAGAVGGVLDAVVDGETGLLVDPTDAGAVAAAASRMLLDRDLATNLGEAGAARARRFTWQRHTGEVRALIETVVDGR